MIPTHTSAPSPSAPAIHFEPVTPDDDADLDPKIRALYIGTGGDVYLRSRYGTASVPFPNVPDGTVIDVGPGRLMEATTATDIIALF